MSLTLLLALALPGAGPSMPEAARRELQALQGEWVAQRFEREGKATDWAAREYVLEIRGDRWIFDGVEKSVIAVGLDPKADPKAIDLRSLERGREGRVSEGIYRIEGDTLTVCLHLGDGRQRPTRFEAGADLPDNALVVYKRVKKD